MFIIEGKNIRHKNFNSRSQQRRQQKGAAIRIKDNFDNNQSYCNDCRKLSNQICSILWRKPRLICRNIFAWSPRKWIIIYNHNQTVALWKQEIDNILLQRNILRRDIMSLQDILEIFHWNFRLANDRHVTDPMVSKIKYSSPQKNLYTYWPAFWSMFYLKKDE